MTDVPLLIVDNVYGDEARELLLTTFGNTSLPPEQLAEGKQFLERILASLDAGHQVVIDLRDGEGGVWTSPEPVERPGVSFIDARDPNPA